MTQASDIQNCMAIPNPVDMFNCMRGVLGYVPVAPYKASGGDGGDGGGACGTDQYSIPVVGCVKKTYAWVGGVGALALFLMTRKKK